MGGAATNANLALRCRADNLHAAEQDYGRDQIERKVGATALYAVLPRREVGTGVFCPRVGLPLTRVPRGSQWWARSPISPRFAGRRDPR
jgi:hypothetical protein